jgi:hypothetical protein
MMPRTSCSQRLVAGLRGEAALTAMALSLIVDEQAS